MNEKIYEVNDVERGYSFYQQLLLSKMINMFKWSNLPKSINERFLNTTLFLNGTSGVVQHNGDLVAIKGNRGGGVDVYGYPTNYIGANPIFSVDLPLNDLVVCDNNTLWTSNKDLINRYARMLSDCDASTNIAIVNSRLTNVVSVSTLQAQMQVDKVLNDQRLGKMSSACDDGLLGDIKAIPIKSETKSSCMEDIVKVRQEIYSQFCVEIGIPMVNHIKRAQLISDETTGIESLSSINIDDMLECREKFCEEMNNFYGTNIYVELNDDWKIEQEKESELE